MDEARKVAEPGNEWRTAGRADEDEDDGEDDDEGDDEDDEDEDDDEDAASGTAAR